MGHPSRPTEVDQGSFTVLSMARRSAESGCDPFQPPHRQPGRPPPRKGALALLDGGSQLAQVSAPLKDRAGACVDQRERAALPVVPAAG